MRTLHETEMSLWFREKRFREDGKIGAFSAAKFPSQCGMPETLCPVQDQTGSHHIALEAKHMGHSNQILRTWWVANAYPAKRTLVSDCGAVKIQA